MAEVGERRERIAEAVWRVLRRDGLAHVSVRAVAQEAGLSLGSLRHFFTTQSQLLQFSLQLVGERVRGRLAALPPSIQGRALVEAVATALVPLDAERRGETEVWLAFLGAALSDPQLRALNEETFDGTSRLFADLVAELVDSGRTRAGLDAGLAAARLHALVDGLALHGVVRPARATPELLHAALLAQLDELCAS